MHLYTHMPFCASKCGYCGFYSVTPRPDGVARYLDAVSKEFRLVREAFPETSVAPETWYIGGGTPSLLGSAGFAALAARFRDGFPLDALREWSVELNPGSVDLPLLETLRRAGVTRLSFGVQSFHDRTLRRIGRCHTVETACSALAAASRIGFKDIGIDLIAGLPDETEADWRISLETACRFGLKHLSVYALTLEPHTRFAHERECGILPPPDDDLMLGRLQMAEDLLGEHGFERYEISNYAQPGYACRHNLAVWRGEDYLGLGPSAASRVGNRRWTRLADVEGYQRALEADWLPPDSTSECLSPREDRVERVLFRLRLAEGLPLGRLREQYPEEAGLFAQWDETLAGLARHGIAAPIPGGWRLTARGREVCDAVLGELMP